MIINESFFYFKGTRTYVQGGEIFNSILETLPEKSMVNIDFSLSTKLATQWSVSEEMPQDESLLVGSFKTSDYHYFIVDTQIPVEIRKEFNESRILDHCTLDEDKILIPAKIRTYTFIEHLIAGFKHILQKSVYPDQPKNYVFMRVVLDSLPYDTDISLQFKRRFAKKFLEAEVKASGALIGKLYFLDE